MEMLKIRIAISMAMSAIQPTTEFTFTENEGEDIYTLKNIDQSGGVHSIRMYKGFSGLFLSPQVTTRICIASRGGRDIVMISPLNQTPVNKDAKINLYKKIMAVKGIAEKIRRNQQKE